MQGSVSRKNWDIIHGMHMLPLIDAVCQCMRRSCFGIFKVQQVTALAHLTIQQRPRPYAEDCIEKIWQLLLRCDTDVSVQLPRIPTVSMARVDIAICADVQKGFLSAGREGKGYEIGESDFPMKYLTIIGKNTSEYHCETK